MKYETMKSIGRNIQRHEYSSEETKITLYENRVTGEYSGYIFSSRRGMKLEFVVSDIGKFESPKEAAKYLFSMLKNFADNGVIDI